MDKREGLSRGGPAKALTCQTQSLAARLRFATIGARVKVVLMVLLLRLEIDDFGYTVVLASPDGTADGNWSPI